MRQDPMRAAQAARVTELARPGEYWQSYWFQAAVAARHQAILWAAHSCERQGSHGPGMLRPAVTVGDRRFTHGIDCALGTFLTAGR